MPDGYLQIEDSWLKGNGTAGCWGGVFFKEGDGYIYDSEIQDATGAITIELSSPEIVGNYVHHLAGTGEDTELPGAYGIAILGDEITEVNPMVHDNLIEDLFGGDGADADALNPAGNGGRAVGVIIMAANPDLVSNQIQELNGGDGGIGYRGTDGTPGTPGLIGPPGAPPIEAGAGGAGGDGIPGGDGGDAFGIYCDDCNSMIIDNTVDEIHAGYGGIGGDGGNGGIGGVGYSYAGTPYFPGLITRLTVAQAVMAVMAVMPAQVEMAVSPWEYTCMNQVVVPLHLPGSWHRILSLVARRSWILIRSTTSTLEMEVIRGLTASAEMVGMAEQALMALCLWIQNRASFRLVMAVLVEMVELVVVQKINTQARGGLLQE